MLVVRNAVPADLEAILALACGIGPGMTTLKADRAALERRLAVVADSFAGRASRGASDYLFVLEDTGNGRLCGVSAIKGAVGLDQPFYSYRIGTSVHAYPPMGLVNRVQALYLSHDMSGAAELCSLYLHPDYRRGSNGRLLSKSRLLFIAQFPQLFPEKIFAEMRGYQTDDGGSPFWESLGRHFFQMDFQQADDLCGQGDRLFIEQLVPRLPLYTHMLGADACAVIGRTHSETVPARRLLEQEGLGFDGHIDIFDAGPLLQARVRDLRAVRESVLLRLEPGAAGPGVAALVANTDVQDFRVAAVGVEFANGVAAVSGDAAHALRCRSGYAVRVYPAPADTGINVRGGHLNAPAAPAGTGSLR
jgi:arginine N-succinyltransferase